jgi:hypothetical protein
MNREATEEKLQSFPTQIDRKIKTSYVLLPLYLSYQNSFDPKEKHVRNRQGKGKKNRQPCTTRPQIDRYIQDTRQ